MLSLLADFSLGVKKSSETFGPACSSMDVSLAILAKKLRSHHYGLLHAKVLRRYCQAYCMLFLFSRYTVGRKNTKNAIRPSQQVKYAKIRFVPKKSQKKDKNIRTKNNAPKINSHQCGLPIKVKRYPFVMRKCFNCRGTFKSLVVLNGRLLCHGCYHRHYVLRACYLKKNT